MITFSFLIIYIYTLIKTNKRYKTKDLKEKNYIKILYIESISPSLSVLFFSLLIFINQLDSKNLSSEDMAIHRQTQEIFNQNKNTLPDNTKETIYITKSDYIGAYTAQDYDIFNTLLARDNKKEINKMFFENKLTLLIN